MTIELEFCGGAWVLEVDVDGDGCVEDARPMRREGGGLVEVSHEQFSRWYATDIGVSDFSARRSTTLFERVLEDLDEQIAAAVEDERREWAAEAECRRVGL